MANGGACLDCDFGDAVDRVQVTTQLLDIYLSASWDFVAEGPSGHGVIEQVMGQAWDWDQRDDVDQSRSLSDKERSARGTRSTAWSAFADDLSSGASMGSCATNKMWGISR